MTAKKKASNRARKQRRPTDPTRKKNDQRRSYYGTDESDVALKKLSAKYQVSGSVVVRAALRLCAHAARVRQDPTLARLERAENSVIKITLSACLIDECSPDKLAAGLPEVTADWLRRELDKE